MVLSEKFQRNFRRKSHGGRPRLALFQRQTILVTYVSHSILTVDRCNGHDRAKQRESEYVKFYDDLRMPAELTPEMETNKRGIKLVAVIKRVLTVTIPTLQKKLLEKVGQSLSLGTIFHYKPFFISYASEKEKVLCMCILCLNTREMFDSLMTYVITVDPNSVHSSITQYFMQGCMQGCHCEWAEWVLGERLLFGGNARIARNLLNSLFFHVMLKMTK